MKKYIYIVLSQTGTFPARVIRLVTHGKYSHASICLKNDFKVLYSFGRIHPYNVLSGGYVKESPDYGTFKRFRNTEVSIVRIETDDGRYNALKHHLEMMYENRKRYRYNYVGLFLAIFNKNFRRQNCFYCSEFVGGVLNRFHIVEIPYREKKIIKPMDLLELPNTDVVYTGKLSAFSTDKI